MSPFSLQSPTHGPEVRVGGSPSVFVWTEVFNCGVLASTVVPSYLAHNKFPLHVFGFERDLEGAPLNPLVRYIPLSETLRQRKWWLPLSPTIDGKFLMSGYQKGHLGTARLWAHLSAARPEEYLVHVDADVVFLGDAVHDVVQALRAGSVIAGPRRAYRHNLNGRDDVRDLPDCVDTLCFGFRRKELPRSTYPAMVRRIRSQTRLDYSRGKRILDFFDSVSLALLEKGPAAYLDSPSEGPSGHRRDDSPFLSKMLAFRSAVGSGCAFAQGFGMDVPDSYRTYALQSYSIYAFYMLGVETGIPRPAPGPIESLIQNLDRETWTIRISENK